LYSKHLLLVARVSAGGSNLAGSIWEDRCR
jgi:hypothetical protein